MSKIILISNEELEILRKNNISYKMVNIFEPEEISNYDSQALERCVFDIIEKLLTDIDDMEKKPLLIRYGDEENIGLIQVLSMNVEYSFSPDWTDEGTDRKDGKVKFIIYNLIDNKLSEVTILSYDNGDGNKSLNWDEKKIENLVNLNYYNETFQFSLTSM